MDHVSGYLHVAFQMHLNTHETINVKDNFKLMCWDHGVVPQSYVLDNKSAFMSSRFNTKLHEFAQIICFAGTGEQHHNGMAEHAIQMIMLLARTMMLHAAIHWPKQADPAFWPMAVTHTMYLYNHVPRTELGVCLANLFTCTHWAQQKFHDCHVWGCPVYMLDKHLSNGKLPHWKPHSKHLLFMNHSPMHASTMLLILNPNSGALSSAFHIVFDYCFAVIPLLDSYAFPWELWDKLFSKSHYQYVFEDDNEAYLVDLGDAYDVDDLAMQDRVGAVLEDDAPASTLPMPPPAASLKSNVNDDSPSLKCLDSVLPNVYDELLQGNPEVVQSPLHRVPFPSFWPNILWTPS